MLIGVLSDTHLTGKPVPESIMGALRGVDMIMHAGDILEMSVIEQLSTIAPTVAVRGNMDHGDVVRKCPESRVIDALGFRIGLTHGYGPPFGMTRKVRRVFEGEELDAIVFGHTHEPLIKEKDGTLFFNPGSSTDKVFASVNTLGMLDITDRISPRIINLCGLAREGDS